MVNWHKEAEGAKDGQKQKDGGCDDPDWGKASDRSRRFGGAGCYSFGDAVAEAIAHIFPGLVGVGDGDG